MGQVGLVKTVVAQVVEQEFISRKIRHERQSFAQFGTGQHQHGLAALVGHGTLAQVSDGADRQDHPQPGFPLVQALQNIN